MDLLDDLDVGLRNPKTFRKEIDISVDTQYQPTQQIQQDSDDEGTQDSSFAELVLKNSSVLGIGETHEPEEDARVFLSPQVPSFSSLLGKNSSILDRVKRRLKGEVLEPGHEIKQPTQETPATQRVAGENSAIEDTQLIDKELCDSTNIQINDTTQLISTSMTRESQLPSTVNLPTLADSSQSQLNALEEDNQIKLRNRRPKVFATDYEHSEEEEETQALFPSAFIDKAQPLDETQPLASPPSEIIHTQRDTGASSSVNNLFVGESEDEEPEATKAEVDKDLSILSESDENELDEVTQKQQRMQKIQELAAKRKNERLLKEQQSKSKENKELEKKKVSFDEEGSEHGNTDYEGKYSDEEKEEAISTNFDLGAHTIKKFPKDSLFAAFGMSPNGDVELTKSSPVKEKETPETSPQGLSPIKEDIELSDSESDSDFDALVLLRKEPPVPKQEPKQAPKIKEPKNVPSVIELDDSDSDVEVEFSKAALFDIKAKISKRKASNAKPKKSNPVMISKRQLFQELKIASRKQIRLEFQGGVQDEKERKLLEKANLNVQDLLQRHIEHNNRIREKEEAERKRRETGEADYEQDMIDEDDDEPEVADSEFSEDENEEDNNNNGDDDNAKIKRRSKSRAVRDDEEDYSEDEIDDSNIETQKTHVAYDNSNDINLGAFGGNLSQSFDAKESQAMKGIFNRISMTQMFEKGTQKSTSNSSDIFGQLRKNANKVIGEESFTEQSSNRSFSEENSFAFTVDTGKVLVDDNEPQTQLAHVEAPDSVAQQDIPSSPTQSEVKRRFKRLTKKRQFEDDESEEESDEEEETVEERNERIRQIELMKQKRRELELEQKRQNREMRAKGLDKIMENEAEESEDEWHGVGGADGEKSDVEDSEDEKMVDDYTKVKINRAELEKKLREENLQADSKMIERILVDLENGRLGKRGKGDHELGLDIDEGEDEIIRTLRLHQQLKMKEQLEKDAALKSLAKHKKAKAFFESITEDSQECKFDFLEDEEDSLSEDENKDNPFQDSKKQEYRDPSTVKKRRITQRFVQKTLSFISNGDYEDSAPQLDFRNSKRYSNDFEETYSDDLSILKQNSIIQIAERTPVKRSDVIDPAEPESSPSNPFKIPSLTAKRSFQITSVDSNTSGEVTYSNQYKASSGNKASVMAFGKKTIEVKKQQLKEQRVLKARRTTKVIQKGNRLKTLNDAGFEN